MSNIQNKHKNKSQKIAWHVYWVPYVGLSITWFTIHKLIQYLLSVNIVNNKNVRKAELLAKNKKVGIIFAMNHTSSFDPFFAIAGSPPSSHSFPMFYVTGGMDMYKKYSKGFWKIIYNRFIFKALGAQSLNTKRGDYSKSLKYHTNLLHQGHSVCIFPEGRLSKDGSINNEVRGGVGYLAIETGAIIVPVYVSGSFKISIKEFITGKRRVTISYGEPFCMNDFKSEEDNTRNKYQQCADKIMERIVSMV